MRGVAQQFDGLQMGIEERRPGRAGVDEDARRAGLQHAASLPQAAVEILPVMCRVAAGQEVERGIRKGQALSRRLDGLDVGKPLLARRGRHGRQHLAREVRGGDPRRVARHQIGDMAATRAEIEGMVRPTLGHNGFERLEVCALRMHGALDIGLSAWPELGLDDAVMMVCHGRFLRRLPLRMPTL